MASVLAAINDLDSGDPVAVELQTFKLQPPAAGAGFTFTPTQTQAWRLLVLTFQLAASAAVATRVPVLRLLDADGTILGAWGQQNGITASQTARTTFAVGVGATLTGTITASATPIPDLVLPIGWSWQVGVVAIDAGDQISLGVVTGEAYWTGKAGEPGAFLADSVPVEGV